MEFAFEIIAWIFLTAIVLLFSGALITMTLTFLEWISKDKK